MTQTEVRISAFVGIVFTAMILAAVFDEFTTRRLSIILVLLFWVPMLVLHELGHAVAAKVLGWRVREIVIGFGRELWRWQLGETRVRVKMAPVEGYVLPMPTSARQIRLKSALIYAAGPGAELALLAVMLLTLGPDYVFDASDELSQVAAQSLAIAILLGAGFNLLPFSTDGGVSDGLGILSSPFMSDQAIEIRLLAGEIRELSTQLDDGASSAALADAGDLLTRFPDNPVLQQLYAAALSADGQDDAARTYVRDRLENDNIDSAVRSMWLNRQARIELNAVTPSFLVLDLAVQKALAIAANDLSALATKGASLVLRGQHAAGGDLLAKVWRRSRGQVDDAELLAYLAIAAGRYGDQVACKRFRTAFEQISRSSRLHALITRELGYTSEATSTAEK